MGKAEWIYHESEIALLAIGSMVEEAVLIREILKDEGHAVSLVNARFMKPIDQEMIKNVARDHSLIVTLEENILRGGFGEAVLTFANQENLGCRILPVALPDSYVEHGSVGILKEMLGFDPAGIAQRIREALQ